MEIIKNIYSCNKVYPLPDLPPMGEGAERSFSPLGETGKGVSGEQGNGKPGWGLL